MAMLNCQNGKYIQFNIDPMTLLRLHYAKACTEHLTGMEVSSAAITRAALKFYMPHLEGLLEAGPEEPQRLLFSLDIRAALRGETNLPNKLPEKLQQLPFPKLSAIIKEHQDGSRERMWEELKTTWPYTHGSKPRKK